MSALTDKYPLLECTNIDPRVTALAGINPWLSWTSSPRSDMFLSHLNQALIVDGACFPGVFSGSEQNLGEYGFSKSRRNQDVRIIKKIPKYQSVLGPERINHNPSLTIIYIGDNDNKINYFTVDTYTRGSHKFGYPNNWENIHLLEEGSFIPQNTRLVSSPAHKNGLYCLGVDLNICYMTLEETIEDAIYISESAAEKLGTTEIDEIKIPVRSNQYPINIYGDDNYIKILPEIGEYVNKDGVLCAFREGDIDTFIADTTQKALSDTNMYDDKYFISAPPGALIVDINVNASPSVKMPKNLYDQLNKYINASNRYWKEIIDVYNKYCLTHKMSYAFINLVTTAIKRLTVAKLPVNIPGVPRRSKTKLIARDGSPIDFMEITVTYMTKRACKPGFKLTGRDGAKGTVKRIVPDKYMPVDDYGFRAEIIMDPASPVNRMTMGPIYEPAINRVSEFVRRKLAALYPVDPKAACDMLMDYYNDINPSQRLAVSRVKTTEKALMNHVEECIREKIHIWVPVGLKTIGFPLIKKLEQKWDVKLSPVEFTQTDDNGDVIGTFRTKKNVCIGEKYIYLLCKIPEGSAACIAHINQYHTPMKPRTSDKNKYPIRRSPIRFIGEDESRNILMDLKDPYVLMRLMCLQSTSPRGVNAVIDALLTSEFPTRIDRIPLSTNELLNSNTILQMFRHLLGTMGVGVSSVGPYPILGKTKKDVL